VKIRLPLDKLHKLRDTINYARNRQKLTLQELQSLIGLLVFTCAVVPLGRTFLRRLIDLTKGLKKPHHKRRLSIEARADFAAWSLFLEHFIGTSLFLDDIWQTSATLQLYTDGSGIGFGGTFGTKWFSEIWTDEWKDYHISVNKGNNKITELRTKVFPTVVAVTIWGQVMANKKVRFFSDNMAVVQVINKQSAKDRNIMTLLRLFIFHCLKFNILFRVKHVPGIDNVLSDKLSRLQIAECHRLAPQMDQFPVEVPPAMFNI
jgi:hypothetical protein